MAAIAVERDEEAPRKKGSGRTAPQAGDAESPLSRTDVLIAAIPTEVLALYTGIVAVILTNSSEDKHMMLRWILYAAGFLAISFWLVSDYLRKRATSRKKRKLPWVETFAALVAFGAWGLVMPGSPLGEELSQSNRNIWYAIITAVALLALGGLGTSIKQQAKPRT
jgi:hypothetical protein